MGQAVVCPLLRGRSPTRSVAPKPLRGLGRAFSPAFRAGSLYPLARGCRRIWRGVILVYWFRRRDAARPDRAAWAVAARVRFIVSGPALTSFRHPYARARARWPGGGLPVATGSLANEIGRAKTAEGSRACFLSGISGWFSLSLGAWVPKNLARRNFGLLVSAGAMLLDRLGPPGRAAAAGRTMERSPAAPRVNLFCHPYARARALMARQWSARCYGVARQRDRSRQNRSRGSGVLSLRHFGLVLFIPWRVGAEESGAAKFWFIGFGRRDAARPARAAWAVQRLAARWEVADLIDFGPRVNLFFTLTRARGR